MTKRGHGTQPLLMWNITEDRTMSSFLCTKKMLAALSYR